MKKVSMNVKAFFKSGISKVVTFCKENKTAIYKLAGKCAFFTFQEVVKKVIDMLFNAN